MPAAAQKTKIAPDGVALLTSRYSTPRPFAPWQLGPLVWLAASFGTTLNTGHVVTWQDKLARLTSSGAQAYAPAQPLMVANDSHFGNAPSVEFDIAEWMQTPDVPTATSTLTIVVVGANQDGTNPSVGIFVAVTVDGLNWTFVAAPTPTAPAQGFRLAEVIIVPRALLAAESLALQLYAKTLYGVTT